MSDIKTKFINDPENITAELLEGYVLAYPNQVKLAAENIVVRANPKGNDKVAIVTLGGSGHEPALSGFVGEGMLDCSVVGDVFAAPGAQRLFQALQLMDREAGILLVVLNHSGDVMSANMACQLAARKGIKVNAIIRTWLPWLSLCGLVRIPRTEVRSRTFPMVSWRSVWANMAKVAVDRNRWYPPMIRLRRW